MMKSCFYDLRDINRSPAEPRIHPVFTNSVDPDQLADLDLHCLPSSMWIYTNNLDQVIWLAEN